MRRNFIFIAILFILLPDRAEAYVDPGLGPFLWQLLFAFGVGLVFQIRNGPLAWLKRKRSGHRAAGAPASAARAAPASNNVLPFQRPRAAGASGAGARSLTLRDPEGHLFDIDGRLIRFLKQDSGHDGMVVLESPTLKRFVAERRLIASYPVSERDRTVFRSVPGVGAVAERLEPAVVLEHERVPFVSFPAEWAPEMLHEAARLTLDLAESLIDEGIGLKDATPHNVLFRGPEPVFVDVASFVRRRPDDSVWPAFGQFVRTFLYPLLLDRYRELPPQAVLLNNPDGLEPQQVYAMAGLAKLFSPWLGLVTIPVWLGRSRRALRLLGGPSRQKSPEMARFILSSLFRHLRRNLKRVAPRRNRRSEWSRYLDGMRGDESPDIAVKERVLHAALETYKPRSVLDVGCNTGHYSRIAALAGASVVAIDADPVVVGRTWRHVRREKLDVLPLVVNIARPTPGSGWNNHESVPFLERAAGAFDLTIFFGLIHHLLVREGIPLPQILDLAARLTRNVALIEYVGHEDRRFQQLARGREYPEYSIEKFEVELRKRFDDVVVHPLSRPDRRVYVGRRRGANG